MIEVVYNRAYHRLTVKGHAGSGEKGRDIVCASASMLAYTLAADIAGYGKCMRGLPEIRLEEGDAEISCTPKAHWNTIITLCFDNLCAGFDILAKNYPQFVSYEVRG